MSNKTGFIFDMDGTIVPSEKLKAESHMELISSFNRTVNIEFYDNCIGKPFHEVVDLFTKEADLDIPFEDYKRLFDEIYSSKIVTIKEPVKGFKAFLNSLKQENILTGLVTSSDRWMVDTIFQNIKTEGLFDVIISKENVTEEKPSPEPYLKAKEQLGVSRIIVFEDTTAGFLSASGVTDEIFAIKHEYNSKQDFSLAKRIFEDYCAIKFSDLI